MEEKKNKMSFWKKFSILAMLAVAGGSIGNAVQINGQLEKAGFERLGSDPTAFEGRVYWNTSALAPKWYSGAAWKTACDLNTTQTLTNKTFSTAGALAPGATALTIFDTAGLSATPYSGLSFTSQSNPAKASIMAKVSGGGTTAGLGFFVGGATPTEAVTIDGATGCVNIGGAGTVNTAYLFETRKTNASASTGIRIFNDDNTSGTSHANLTIRTGGTSSGDPSVIWDGGAVNFSAGIDNSDSDSWVLSRSSALGTNNVMRADGSTGAVTFTPSVGFGGTPSFPIDVKLSTATTSDAATGLRIENSGAGDAVMRWATGAQAWHAGIDQSDSNKFKIGVATWDGAGTVLAFNTSGNILPTTAGVHNGGSGNTGNASNPSFASGTSTPTITAVLNSTGGSNQNMQWMRVGNVVTCSGRVDVTASAAGNASVRMSLPVASAMTGNGDLAGTAVTVGIATPGMEIKADAVNDEAVLLYTATAAQTISWFYHFTYLVR